MGGLQVSAMIKFCVHWFHSCTKMLLQKGFMHAQCNNACCAYYKGFHHSHSFIPQIKMNCNCRKHLVVNFIVAVLEFWLNDTWTFLQGFFSYKYLFLELYNVLLFNANVTNKATIVFHLSIQLPLYTSSQKSPASHSTSIVANDMKRWN